MTKKKLTDIEVSEFLESFRERPQKEQEASPVYQSLIQFPGWGMAGVQPKRVEAPEMDPDIPDPRKAPLERAREMRERGQITDTGKGKPQPGAMTTASSPGQPNPWAEVNFPPADGPCFLGVRTETPPPFPGTWERHADGWFRKG